MVENMGVLSSLAGNKNLHKAVWALVIGAIALWGFVAFGVLSFTTSLWTAIGVAIVVVGLVRLLQPGNAPLPSLGLAAGGIVLIFLQESVMPQLTLGELASFVGAGA